MYRTHYSSRLGVNEQNTCFQESGPDGFTEGLPLISPAQGQHGNLTFSESTAVYSPGTLSALPFSLSLPPSGSVPLLSSGREVSFPDSDFVRQKFSERCDWNIRDTHAP